MKKETFTLTYGERFALVIYIQYDRCIFNLFNPGF